TREEEVMKDAVVFKEGDEGDSMYIIFRGSVRIHKGERTLATFNEKDFFGELSLLDPETRSATATALSDCLLLELNQEPLYDLFETQPEVMRGIIRILCRRIRSANKKIMELTEGKGTS